MLRSRAEAGSSLWTELLFLQPFLPCRPGMGQGWRSDFQKVVKTKWLVGCWGLGLHRFHLQQGMEELWHGAAEVLIVTISSENHGSDKGCSDLRTGVSVVCSWISVIKQHSGMREDDLLGFLLCQGVHSSRAGHGPALGHHCGLGELPEKNFQLERAAKVVTLTAGKALPQSWTARIYWHKTFPFSLALSDSAKLREAQQGVPEQHLKASFSRQDTVPPPLIRKYPQRSKTRTTVALAAQPFPAHLRVGRRKPWAVQMSLFVTSKSQCSLPEPRTQAVSSASAGVFQLWQRFEPGNFILMQTLFWASTLLGNFLLSALLSWTWKMSGFFHSLTEIAVLLLGRNDQTSGFLMDQNSTRENKCVGLLKIWARFGQRRKPRAKLALASYVYPVLQFSSLSFLPLWGDFWGGRGSRWNLCLCWCLDFPVDSVQSIHEMEFSTQQQAQGFPQVTAQLLQGQLARATTPSTASTPMSPPAPTWGKSPKLQQDSATSAWSCFPKLQLGF